MIVECLAVGPLRANAYLLVNEGRAVIVDPGGEAERLLSSVARWGAELTGIWLTHAHFDHVGALSEVLAARSVPVYLHPADAPLLASAARPKFDSLM